MYDIETVEVYADIVDEDGSDNWNSLYQSKKTYFKTIRSCYSFTVEEMYEMYFMNNAANYLLQNVYKGLESTVSAPVFTKQCYEVIKTLEGFNHIQEQIIDIFNPATPPKSIRQLDNKFRVDRLNEFLEENSIYIKAEVARKCLEAA